MRNVICLKVGDKYPSQYVNILFNMCRRNVTGDFRFICFTDDSRGINSEIECAPLPTNNPLIRGWFYKLSFFQNELYNIKGTILYLDLDIIIIKNIDELFKINKFTVIEDWLYRGKFNSSVMGWESGELDDLFFQFISNYRINKKYTGDQDFLSNHITNFDFWDKNWCISYKFSMNENRLPDNSKIIVFHGKPNPHEVINIDWVKKHWK